MIQSFGAEVSQLRIFSEPLLIQFLTSVMKLTTLFGFGLLSLSEKLAHEPITGMAHESFDFPSGRMTQLFQPLPCLDLYSSVLTS